MKRFFEEYPQFVCIDILCNIPQLDTSLILLIGLDGNGHCEIISVGLLKSEDTESFTWFCDVFKKHNVNWKNMKILLSHRNIDREILENSFPEKLNFLSFFHCMRAFKDDLSNLDPSMPSEEINKALLLFEQMIFTTSASGYQEVLRQMKLNHPQIYSLFKKTWHQKKNLWLLGLCMDSKIFLKAFNTFLKDIRRRIKFLTSTEESYKGVIGTVHSVVLKLRKETFHKFTRILHSPAAPNVRALKQYKKDVLPFALELINEQLIKSESLQDVKQVDYAAFMVDGTPSSYMTCSCNFYTLMMLPCCHMLKVRKFLDFPMYFAPLKSCSLLKSWSPECYLKSFSNLYSLFATDTYEDPEVVADKVKRFAFLLKMSFDLWPEYCDCLEAWKDFENSCQPATQRLEVHSDLLKSWKSDFKVDVNVTDSISDSNMNNEAMKDMPTDAFKQMYGISLSDILDSENDFPEVPIYSEVTTDDGFMDF